MGRKESREVKKRKELKDNIREWCQSLFIAFIVAMFIRTFFIQAFRIPTGSMIPTLRIGDHLLVNKLIYKIREPERGEVIVFLYPENPKKPFIKRLIGLPGESIKINEGRIYINGRLLNGPPTITGRDYIEAGRYGTREIKIPPKNYYVLGDNVHNSKDSRYWGFVPDENLVGKAILIYWPPWRIGVIR